MRQRGKTAGKSMVARGAQEPHPNAIHAPALVRDGEVQ